MTEVHRTAEPRTSLKDAQKLCMEIQKRHDLRQHLRIGQILVNVARGRDIFYIENDELIKLVKEFAGD